jgi:hypothetical protein
MIKKHAISSLFLISTLSVNLSANANDRLPYFTMANTEITINATLTKNYVQSYKKFLNRLSNCTPFTFSGINPTHGKKSLYKIIGVATSGRCHVEFRHNEHTEFKCGLGKRDINTFVRLRSESLESLSNLETFTPSEYRILDNKKQCLKSTLSSNKLSKDELKNILKKNPNAAAIINSLKQ